MANLYINATEFRLYAAPRDRWVELSDDQIDFQIDAVADELDAVLSVQHKLPLSVIPISLKKVVMDIASFRTLIFLGTIPSGDDPITIRYLELTQPGGYFDKLRNGDISYSSFQITDNTGNREEGGPVIGPNEGKASSTWRTIINGQEYI